MFFFFPCFWSTERTAVRLAVPDRREVFHGTLLPCPFMYSSVNSVFLKSCPFKLKVPCWVQIKLNSGNFSSYMLHIVLSNGKNSEFSNRVVQMDTIAAAHV